MKKIYYFFEWWLFSRHFFRVMTISWHTMIVDRQDFVQTNAVHQDSTENCQLQNIVQNNCVKCVWPMSLTNRNHQFVPLAPLTICTSKKNAIRYQNVQHFLYYSFHQERKKCNQFLTSTKMNGFFPLNTYKFTLSRQWFE